MNRFTNEDMGIVPFQMIKLAATNVLFKDAVPSFINFLRGTPKNVTTAADGITSSPIAFRGNAGRTRAKTTGSGNTTSATSSPLLQQQNAQAVNININNAPAAAAPKARASVTTRGVVKGVEKLLNGVASKSDIIDAAKVLNHNISNLGVLLQKAMAAKDEKLIAQLTELMLEVVLSQQALAKQFPEYALLILDGQASLSKKIPGVVKLTGTTIAGAGIYDGAKTGISHLANRDADNAHAAGTAAAKEGELAAKQNGQGGSWWDNTWNDINKFREEHPGWFYGLSGVGLLGGGYALSEMLDDDDEEEEYPRY